MCGQGYDHQRGSKSAQDFREFKIPAGVTVAYPDGMLRCGPCRKGQGKQADVQQKAAQPGTVPKAELGAVKQRLAHMRQEKDRQKARKEELKEEQRKRQDEFKTKLEGKYENHMKVSSSERKFVEEYREVRKKFREAGKPDLLRILLTVLITGRLLLESVFFEFLFQFLVEMYVMKYYCH